MPAPAYTPKMSSVESNSAWNAEDGQKNVDTLRIQVIAHQKVLFECKPRPSSSFLKF